MAMRQLVTGADACGPSDGSDAGPANAAAALANQLLGMGNDKTQERLHQVRTCGTSVCAGTSVRITSMLYAVLTLVHVELARR